MVRVLIVGPVTSLDASVAKLNKLNAKSGPFELCLLLGPPSKVPQQGMPMPTYFVADSFDNDKTPRPVGHRLSYKGSRVNESVHGLRLLMCANDEDAIALCKELEQKGDDLVKVDLMVTHCGPSNSAVGGDVICRLGRLARPRYHFFGADKFEAFSPFQAAGADYATRVVSVGGSGRWVYAADVARLDGMSEQDRRATLPQRLGEVLYGGGVLKRTREWNVEKVREGKRGRKDCWFCLSNEVERHLVVAVGENVYVALAKGGINDSHLVIVPVTHVTGSTSEQVCEEIVLDVERFIKAIQEYYKKCKNSEAMIFEWCGEAEMMHMCVQTVAIRKEACGRVAKVCIETAKRFGLEVNIEDGVDGLREARRRGGRECFWAELPGGQRLVAKFEEKNKLPANFGRVVVTQVLGIVHRLDWRKCVQPTTVEEQLADSLSKQLTVMLL